MSVDAMHAAATAHGGVPLPEKDRPIGAVLGVFGRVEDMPRLPHGAIDERDWSGAWLIWLESSRVGLIGNQVAAVSGHLIAVSVDTSGRQLWRYFADNATRRPVGFSRLRSAQRCWIVRGAWRFSGERAS